jgi:HSP20 family molecular chaperone IbpA
METPTELLRAPEIFKLFAGDPLFERLQEIRGLIARRAYELSEARGFTHGHELEDWLRAQSEILRGSPVDIRETETELTIYVEVPGFRERDLEVRVEPRRLFISGKRQEAPERKQGNTVYSERQANQILFLLDLPVPIDPDKVNATLSDGVLEIKLLTAEAGKKIPVRTKAATA